MKKWDVILCADCWLRWHGLPLGRGVLGFVRPSQRKTPKVRQGITNKLRSSSKIMRPTVCKRRWNCYMSGKAVWKCVDYSNIELNRISFTSNCNYDFPFVIGRPMEHVSEDSGHLWRDVVSLVRERLVQRRSVTSLKNWILSSTSVRTSYLAMNMFPSVDSKNSLLRFVH